MNALASLLAYGGFVALAFAMPRHHRAVFARDLPTPRRHTLRTVGWVSLVLSLAAAFAAYGSEVGAVAWFAIAASAGFVLTLLLTYTPRYWPLPLAGLLLLACLGSAS